MWHKVIGTHGKRNLMKLSPLKVEPNLILEPRNPTPKPPIAAASTGDPNWKLYGVDHSQLFQGVDPTSDTNFGWLV